MNAAVRLLREERVFLKTLIKASWDEQRSHPQYAEHCLIGRTQLLHDLKEIENALDWLMPGEAPIRRKAQIEAERRVLLDADQHRHRVIRELVA